MFGPSLQQSRSMSSTQVRRSACITLRCLTDAKKLVYGRRQGWFNLLSKAICWVLTRWTQARTYPLQNCIQRQDSWSHTSISTLSVTKPLHFICICTRVQTRTTCLWHTDAGITASIRLLTYSVSVELAFRTCITFLTPFIAHLLDVLSKIVTSKYHLGIPFL